MSLLNDMLRDLSRNRSAINDPGFKAQEVSGCDEDLLQASSINQKRQSPWLQMLVFFIVIFCAVLGIRYVLGHTPPAATHATAIHKSQASTVSTASRSSFAASSIAPVASQQLQDEESMVDKELAAVSQEHIKELLQQAERAIAMDRLTSPVEDNAYGYYQKILALDVNNEEAKEGLDKIASRYLLKAEELAKSGNSAQVEALVQRARFVSSRYVDAHAIPAPDSIHDENEAEHSPLANTQLQAVPASETVKTFSVAEAPEISVTPNVQWKDEQLASHAQELVQQGKQMDAVTLLKNFIVKEQKPARSASLLAEIYLQRGDVEAATVIAEKLDYLAPDDRAKLQAQILLAKGDDTQAMSVLEKNINTASKNEAYRSLLASLYHKTANYQQSIISYQGLINSFGEKPAYWLGLALAYDGLSQHKSALQAYLRLQEYPQLQVQVKKYSDQRIAALRSE